MTEDPFAEAAARPLWLTTLADLALLLVGFFVLLQTAPRIDPRALADGLRGGVGAAPTHRKTAPIALALARIQGFAPGSAVLPPAPGATAWARDVARDPRTRIRIQGDTDVRGDVDPATGSAAILAADRARAVAALLVRTGVAPDRIAIATGPGAGRTVTLTIDFAGARQ